MFFVPAAIIADAPSFSTIRNDADAKLRAMLSADQRTKLAGVEGALRDDLRAALGRARDRTGGIAAILTDDQRAAIAQAFLQGTEADVELSDGQKAKLNAFASALRDGVVPAWRSRAHEADALLTGDQRSKVIALRNATAATSGAAIAGALPGVFVLLPATLRAPFSPTFDDVAAIVAGPDGAGAFALLIDLPAGVPATAK